MQYKTNKQTKKSEEKEEKKIPGVQQNKKNRKLEKEVNNKKIDTRTDGHCLRSSAGRESRSRRKLSFCFFLVISHFFKKKLTLEIAAL